MNRPRKFPLMPLLFVALLLFLLFEALRDPAAGAAQGRQAAAFSLSMVKILPLAFILVGLFEVWVERDKVERHFGRNAGPMSFVWALLLGGTTVGPMIVALPVAAALHRKGARLSVVFSYIGAAAVCRVPMTIFESSYLGILFTLVRYVVSLPLIVFSSILLGRFLEKKEYRILEE